MIEAVQTLPVTRKQAFSILLDVSRWSEWLPFRVREEDAVLEEAGDRVSFHYRSFRLPINATATLDELVPDESFRMTIRIPGSLPVRFDVSLLGTGTKGVVAVVKADFDVPGGQLARSIWSRSLVPVVVRRELDSALDRVHDLLAEPLLEA